MKQAKVIVFDLDGTLYADTHHFDYYAKLIRELLPEEVKDSYSEQYEAALNGKHAVRIGRVYDAKKDLLLMQEDGEVLEAYDWEGTKLADDSVAELYPEPIQIDLTDMVSIGDQWWIPPVLARHYGIGPEQTYEAFQQTREWMMGPEFVMEPIAGLADQLRRLSESKRLVLLTNSPQADSEAILVKLGLADVFDHKIFMGQKPMESQNHFKAVAKRYDCAFHEIISIGDNWVNDIHPPRRLGCRTIFIDWHQTGRPDSADIVVRSMQEAVEIFKTW